MKQLPKIPKQSCYYIDLKKTDNAHAYIPQKNYFMKRDNFWELLDSPSTSFRTDRRRGERKWRGDGNVDHLVFHRKNKNKKKLVREIKIYFKEILKSKLN